MNWWKHTNASIPDSDRNNHHWNVGTEKKAVGESRIEKARKDVFLFVWHDNKINLIIAQNPMELFLHIFD